MKSNLFFKAIPLLLLPYTCAAQNLWVGLSHSLSLNLTDVNDFDALAFNPSHVSLTNHYHFNVGYQFGQGSLFIETGFGKSNYAIAFSIKDGDPVVYGFEKPMRVKNNFFALEIPIKIGYRLNLSNDTKFFGSLGVVAMWSISPSVEHVEGSLLRNNEDILYRFDYQLQSTSKSWNSTRLEFGFGASHSLGRHISLRLEAILGMGLHPNRITSIQL